MSIIYNEITFVCFCTAIIIISLLFVSISINFFRFRRCKEIIKAKYTGYQILMGRDEMGYKNPIYSRCVISCKFKYNNKNCGGQSINSIRRKKAETLEKGQEIIIKIDPQNPNKFIHCIK